MEIFSDEYFMSKALEQAHIAAEAGEVPVGAIVVCNKQIIAKSYNQTEMLNDVTAHAEMLAITSAANYLGSKYLHNCEIFVTLEPCPMCAGLLVHSRIKRLVIAANDLKTGAAGSAFNLVEHEKHNHKIDVSKGVLAEQCSALLSAFFKRRRAEIKARKVQLKSNFNINAANSSN